MSRGGGFTSAGRPCRNVFVDVDADEVALRFTALTDGLGIQVLTGMITPRRMRAALITFMEQELLA